MSLADIRLLLCNLEKKWIINRYSKWMYRKSNSVAINLYFQPKWNIITITFTRHFPVLSIQLHIEIDSAYILYVIFLYVMNFFIAIYFEESSVKARTCPFILLLLRMNPMILVLPVSVLFLLTLYRIRTLRSTLRIVPGVDLLSI